MSDVTGAMIAIIAAVSGYLANHILERRKDSRLRKIARIEAQLRDLYGPMLAISFATRTIFRAWLSAYRDGKPYFMSADDPPTSTQLVSWRQWVATVLQPLNEKMTSLILSHSHLIDSEEFPEQISLLLAHVEGYRPVIKAWSDNDFSRHLSIVNYPETLHEYVCAEYERLSRRYSQLLKKN